MRSLGRQLLVELYDCDPARIDDPARVRESMLEAARRARATIVTEAFHRFNPQGVSGVVVIAESHLAVHTWPEHGCASIDLFSCSDRMDAWLAIEHLRIAFGAGRMECREIARGAVLPPAPAAAPEAAVQGAPVSESLSLSAVWTDRLT